MIHGLDVFVHLGCMLLGCLTAVVTALTYRLTYEYSTFCPHGVFVFCVDLRTNSVFTARYLYHFFFFKFSSAYKTSCDAKFCVSGTWVWLV